MIYNLVGRLLFPRRQEWAQRKSAKTLVFTAAFSLALGVFLAEVIRMIYNHQK